MTSTAIHPDAPAIPAPVDANLTSFTPLSDLPTEVATPSVALRAARIDALPCVDDPDAWFADTDEAINQAKATCQTCPVREACLRAALERGEPIGVWGGQLFRDGRVIPRKPRRGRPPKNRVPELVS